MAETLGLHHETSLPVQNMILFPGESCELILLACQYHAALGSLALHGFHNFLPQARNHERIGNKLCTWPWKGNAYAAASEVF